ncbi:MAG: AAA family ATPase, partial [Verrucomicrobia bacterium]|nr:AAA family ATPase [Verrucomicrobiota bacterium]
MQTSLESPPKSSRTAAENFQRIPAELRALPQWVCWKLETVGERLTKIPYSAAGRSASTTDPATWASFDQCLAAHNNGGKFSGIGFVFTDGNGLTGVDLDHHRDPATGELDEFAKPIVARLNTYAETSQSGTGVHIIARGVIPSDKGKRDAKQGVEMYSTARFFVMTGQHLDGTPTTVERRQAAVSGLFQELFGERKQEAKPAPAPVLPLTLTDNDLVNRASRASNGVNFSALWRGDFASAGFGSQSEADGALLSMLHFWTGGDKDRSFRLFSQSGLSRDKWDRADYRESTWALVANGKTYSPRSTAQASPAQLATVTSPPAETPQPPTAKHLSQLDRRTDDDPNELLKSAYLCRGGGALWVAPTGIGKSVAELQAAILWAIGLPFFGIAPTRPLKSLIIQAENDEGDLGEFADGIVQGLRLTPAQIKQADANVIFAREDSRTGLPLCIYTIEPLLAAHRPDMLWLDPANSYLGGDTNSQEVVGGFLRNMLNPLLRKYACGGNVIHHTPKPPKGKDKAEWQ